MTIVLNLGRQDLIVLRFVFVEQRICLRFWILWAINDFSSMDRTGYVLRLLKVI